MYDDLLISDILTYIWTVDYINKYDNEYVCTVYNNTCIQVGFEARGESIDGEDVHSALEISSRTGSCPYHP